MDFDPNNKPFPVLKNDCIIRAALGLKTDFVPVWIMRQAGRHLPEFRELREKHPFFEVCQTPTLACELTLQPMRRYDLDAAIIFTDILVILQALGMTVILNEHGLRFPNPIKPSDDLASVLDFNADVKGKLHYVYEAITLTRHSLDAKCPLFGFAGGPWNLMSYMFSERVTEAKSEVREYLYNEKEKAHQLLQLLTDKTIDYLVEQVKAGAQILQIFESSAGVLTRDEFKEFSYPYILKICTEVKAKIKQLAPEKKVPIVVFPKGSRYGVDLLGQSQNADVIDVLALNHLTDIKKARESTNLTLQGNMNPITMHSNNHEEIRKSVEKIIREFGTQKYIANLGDGILPKAKVEAVKVFIDSVHEVSRECNKSL